MTIKERIKAVATKAFAEKIALYRSTYESLADWDKRQKEIEAEVRAITKEVGDGLVIGKVLWFWVADGVACYIVTKVRKNDVVVEWIPMGDMYFSDAVGVNRNRTEYVVNRQTAEAQSGRGSY